jgi:drug/metabolite transporter (DMT)-like permease
MTGGRLRARLALLAATAIWGGSFVVVQKALARLAPFHLLALRFTLASLLLLPLLRGRSTRELRRDAAVIGLVLFAGFVLQTYGLLWTTPSRSAFLTGLSVVLVPVVGLAIGAYRPRFGPIAGTLCAAAGLYVLYRPEAGGAPFNRGDALTIGCAVAFAGYVVLVGRAVRRHPMGPLAAMQLLVLAALSLPSLFLDPPARQDFAGFALPAVLYTGILSTALAFLAQLYAQRQLDAIETGVILTLEPVFAALASVLIGVEQWSSALLLGGALVVAAMLVTELGGGAEEPPAAPHAY